MRPLVRRSSKADVEDDLRLPSWSASTGWTNPTHEGTDGRGWT